MIALRYLVRSEDVQQVLQNYSNDAVLFSKQECQNFRVRKSKQKRDDYARFAAGRSAFTPFVLHINGTLAHDVNSVFEQIESSKLVSSSCGISLLVL